LFRPEAAATTSFRVEEGDLILLATDGLFDNLPAHLIENELKQFNVSPYHPSFQSKAEHTLRVNTFSSTVHDRKK